MSAVSKAHSLVMDAIDAVPREPHDNKSSLLRKAAGALGLSYWQAKKIRYGEVKSIDADKLESMRERYDEFLQRLASLKAQADDNQARLNELIYWRTDAGRIVRAGQTDAGGSRSAAGREREAPNSGSLCRQDRPRRADSVSGS